MKRLVFKFFVIMIVIQNKIFIKLIPFRYIIQIYSYHSYKPYEFTFSDDQLNRIRLIQQTVLWVKKSVLKTSKCFDQSLTAIFLARFFKLPCEVSFGIRKNNDSLIEAHSWTKIGPYYVTGVGIIEQFTEVYSIKYYPRKR